MTRRGARRVAVLGAGIMGGATALLMARAGAAVRLYDAAPEPFAGASRWNEGKIHLGHLYAADPSLATARRVLPGGLAFPGLLRDLIGEPLEAAVTPHDDLYLVHRDSLVPAPAMAAYLEAVTALVRGHPDAGSYFADLGAARVRRLSETELAALGDPAVVRAGFRVPERSVDTRWVADRFAGALRAEPGVALAMGHRVDAVRREHASSPMWVDTDRGCDGPFDVVVNALWEGRLAIDAGLGLPVPVERNHRFRLSLFLDAGDAPDLPCAVVATGPFGDLKNYGGGRYYASWYPSGLRAEGDGISPPAVPPPDAAERGRIGGDILRRLAEALPGVAALAAPNVKGRLEGGWVYAAGSGSLADRDASLHRRDRLGVTRSGGYFSVDTGKYSVAPWLAREIVREVFGD